MTTQDNKDQGARWLGCVGFSAKIGEIAHCNAQPRWSVSEHIDQRTDYRVCGLHLSWLVRRLNEEGHDTLVIARLVKS